MNRKSYARISATPGKTQTINFYNINNAMYLVDLPGYGYAKVTQEVKEQWGKLIERYLHGSKRNGCQHSRSHRNTGRRPILGNGSLGNVDMNIMLLKKFLVNSAV